MKLTVEELQQITTSAYQKGFAEGYEQGYYAGEKNYIAKKLEEAAQRAVPRVDKNDLKR